MRVDGLNMACQALLTQYVVLSLEAIWSSLAGEASGRCGWIAIIQGSVAG